MLKTILQTCVDMIAPRRCHTCGAMLRPGANAFDENICSDCARRMPLMPTRSCPFCAGPLETGDPICGSCRQHEAPAFDEARACFFYAGPVRNLVHQMKYDERPYLAKTARRLMRKNLPPRFIKEADAIVPVPLSAARRRERTFNQAEEIAKELAAAYAKPVTRALERCKETRSQTRLKEKNRFANVAGAFRVADEQSLSGQDILLVDDVITTSATARAAALALKKAGARRVRVLALAKG